MNTSSLPRFLILAALLPLAGCAQNPAPGTARPAAPGATRVITTNNVGAVSTGPLPPGVTATLSEAEKGRTVRIGPSETVAIRLNVDPSTGNRWFLANRLEGQVLYKKGDTTYAPTTAGTVATVLYQGLHTGKQELHFYYAPPDERQNVARTADFAVIVR